MEMLVNSIAMVLSLLILSLSTSTPLYGPHCNRIVPDSPLTAPANPAKLRFSNALFTGGYPIFPLSNSTSKSSSLKIKSFSSTRSPTTFFLSGFLTFLQNDQNLVLNVNRRGLRHIINRHPRVFPRNGKMRRKGFIGFEVSGFYSDTSKKLCMVGNGLNGSEDSVFVDVVLNLDYPIVNDLENGVVKGTLVGTNTSLFEVVSILGFPGAGGEDYVYKYVDEEVKKGGFRVFDNTENVDVKDSNFGLCNAFHRVGRLELEYSEGCENVGCNPINGSIESLPSFMSLNEISCEGGKGRYLLDFSGLYFPGRRLPFNPNTSLVAEGAWNEKSHLDLVACRWINVNESLTNVSIGDCSIRMSLRFPKVLDFKNRSSVVGMVWSTKKADEKGYFSNFTIQTPTNGNMMVQDRKYVYSVIENATNACSKKVVNKYEKGKYPDAFSSDMRFDMSVVNGQGQKAWGYSSPLSVGDRFYQHRSMFADNSQVRTNSTTQTGSLNVSYIISFQPSPSFKLSRNDKASINYFEISAEGIYNPSTGLLCMIGCRHIKPLGKVVPKNKTLDCELVISIQYPSSKSKAGSEAKGTIRSNRQKTDPLYFDQLKLHATSLTLSEVRESIWTMDFEITMVLISNTLMCIFVISQLLYVKKFPEVLPFISLMMLTVLTLAQLIPLVLNFEALFKVNGNKQTVYLGSGGWVEVNEVLVRVITMIAFLLEFRLLQQAWSSRLGDGISNTLWASDKKVLYVSIPVYIAGALIAYLVHEWKSSYKKTIVISLHEFGYKRYSNNNNSFWRDFKSYVGLVLDGFLLPQIAFNVFCNTREKALAPLFYVGTTVVRLMPHAYDLYKAHESSQYSGGFYADPGMDYYSTMWDIVISIGGLVFIVLVFLQQRFGGRCFLPKRFRESVEYEKVPVVSTELSPR